MSSQAALQPHWSEGLLLCPQHLQQQDRYHEARLLEIARTLRPDFFGLVEASIDEAALAAGELRIPSLRAILPDGTPLRWDPASPMAPVSRPIAPAFPSAAELLEVRVALADARPGARNVGDDEGASRRRFRRRSLVVHDVGGSHPAREIAVIEPSAQILLGDEPREGTSSVAIAALRRRGDGGFALADDYVPPVLALAASPYLRRELDSVLGVAIARRRALMDECNQRTGGRLEYRANDLDRHLMIHALGRLIPSLRGLLDRADATPIAAYDLLVATLGELSSFVTDCDPAGLPRFNHQELRGTFGPLFREAQRLARLPLESDIVSINLKAREDGLWIAEFPDERVRRSSVIFLGVRGDQGDPRALHNVADLAKIAAWRRIQAIVRSNSRGAPLRLCHRPPPALAARDGEVYFAVECGDAHWQEVLYERNIAIHLAPPHEPRRTHIRLIAIPNPEGEDDGLVAASGAPRV
ncbi:MAG: type VI secretion system baseplate subunit TssK [Nannocystaceae bacterium]